MTLSLHVVRQLAGINMDFGSKSTGRWTIPSKWLPKRVQDAASTDSDGNDSEMLSAIFDALSAHVVLLDRFGRVEHASRSWLEFGRDQRRG